MRQSLLMGILLFGAGCHGLGERIHGRHGCAVQEPCETPPKKSYGAPPEKPREAKAPETPRQDTEAARAAVAQDVLLVPRMVYMPYVAQVPTGPMRLAANQLPGGPEPVGAPRQPVGEPNPDLKKAVEICEKLQDRINQLEKRLQDRVVAPAPPVCPPQPWIQPIFRRPIFHRANTYFPPCDPSCGPIQPCDPVTNSGMSIGVMPASSTSRSGPVLTLE